jgi:hypothetical protein
MRNGLRNGLCEDAVGHSVSEYVAKMHMRDATATCKFGNCDCPFGRYMFCNLKIVNKMQGRDVK